MKKLSIAFALLLAFSLNANAQKDFEFGYFNHLSIGVSTGTDGLLGVDLATPIGKYVQARVGFGTTFGLSINEDIDYTITGGRTPGDYTTEAGFKTNLYNAKLLFDVYPFKKSSFHLTVGAYMGPRKIVEVKNNEPIQGISQADYGIGLVQIGNNPENWFSTDGEGNIKGRVRTSAFRPYFGFGFGRDVPKKRVNVSFNLGVQLWNTPKVEIARYDLSGQGQPGDPEYTVFRDWKEIKKADFDKDDDGYDVMNAISKLKVYPVLNVRIGFRVL